MRGHISKSKMFQPIKLFYFIIRYKLGAHYTSTTPRQLFYVVEIVSFLIKNEVMQTHYLKLNIKKKKKNNALMILYCD